MMKRNMRKNSKPRVYSYIVTHDTGFAPNPFWGSCTLACCKPVIRRVAEVGDIIVGLSSKTLKEKPHHLIYAMKVTEDPITFDEYYNSKKYFKKKPVINASYKDFVGDNIYIGDSYKGNGKIHNTPKKRGNGFEY